MDLSLNASRLSSSRYSTYFRVTLSVAVIVCGVDLVAETGLPWDTPFEKVVASLTGPIAWGIALIAFAATGFTLVFGRSDLSEYAVRIIYIILALAVVFLAGALISAIFGVAKPTLPDGARLPIALLHG